MLLLLLCVYFSHLFLILKQHSNKLPHPLPTIFPTFLFLSLSSITSSSSNSIGIISIQASVYIVYKILIPLASLPFSSLASHRIIEYTQKKYSVYKFYVVVCCCSSSTAQSFFFCCCIIIEHTGAHSKEDGEKKITTWRSFSIACCAFGFFTKKKPSPPPPCT